MPNQDEDIFVPGYWGNQTQLIPVEDMPCPANEFPPESPMQVVPRPGGADLEGILGVENRLLVRDPTAYPWSAICSLAIVNRNGKKFVGTGFLAGPRMVVTAGHNIFWHGEGFMEEITVYPGLNGDRAAPPFRAATCREFVTVDAWRRDADRTADFGAIFLPTDLGLEAGWLSMASYSEGTLRGITANLSGYPKIAPDGYLSDGSLQFRDVGRITPEAQRLTYNLDTTVGQSGSPVFAFMNRSRDPYQVIGIHNTTYQPYNAATRLTRAVFDRIMLWREESESTG